MDFIEIYFLIVLTTLIHLFVSAFIEHKRGASLAGIEKAKSECSEVFSDLVNVLGLPIGALVISSMVIVITLAWVSVLPFIRIRSFLKHR